MPDNDSTAATAVRCSFCDRPHTEVATLVAGPGVFICDTCVELCAGVIAGKPVRSGPALAPWDQVAELDVVLAQLGPVARTQERVDGNLTAWVDRARVLGASWARIGGALGISRQSAWERFAGA
jgi:hypothetical protein